MITVRCVGGKRQKGCGKWLVKLDERTLEVVKRRRFVAVYDMLENSPRDFSGELDRFILHDPGDPSERSRLEQLHARGVNVGRVPEDEDREVAHRDIRCNCGAHYTIPSARERYT